MTIPLFFALSAFSTVARAECGDRASLLDELDQQVLEGRFEQAEITKQTVVAAFACGSLAEPTLVARLWLAEAVMLAARDDPGAPELFAAASRLSPTTWTEAYGPSLRKRWEEAERLPVKPSGTVRIDPLVSEYIAALDGTVLVFPAQVPAGPHLLQVGPRPTEMASALRFDLPPGIDLVLDPKVTRPVEPPAVAPTRDLRGRRILHALVVGGVGAAVYSATFATNAAFYHSPPAQRSVELRAVNDGMVITSGVVGAASAVLLVRGITSPPATP